MGGALLADALERAIRSEIAAYALMVDAKDGTATAFYRHHGLSRFQTRPDTVSSVGDRAGISLMGAAGRTARPRSGHGGVRFEPTRSGGHVSTASAWRVTRPRGDPMPMTPTRHLPLRCRRSSPRQGQTQRDPQPRLGVLQRHLPAVAAHGAFDHRQA
ncbi:MAG TPA: hypothetical protein PLV36_16705, partial [Zoogloea sp.]|nr:hypothetical protein [Zoogloea sp.]